ncbi:thiamine pyrophosphokinase [Exophiala viscosa]|uniref:Thiamine pyrophosphokinase n=1 Tax=Exophiala viscosa TaxID=2486360 RepID=A0AAN6DZD6_9EURO|nr:thiamine pyrophosphokinase [Exophiala viscosa]KAI1624043.1 thiamine pyrophosphokinase [Exophiala viscosa]
MGHLSNLDIVNECDNFPYYSDNPEIYTAALKDYYQFRLEGCDSCLGYTTSTVAAQMPPTKDWNLDHDKKHLTFQPRSTSGEPVKDFAERNQILAEYLQDVREKKVFRVLDGWRSELYPIYGPSKTLLLNMERSATPLFGVVTYGVHMTGYVKTPEGMKIWAPRRALTKQTYPGMMDNTVAGGLSTGEKPFECLVRECEEEASLPADVVQSAQACGTLTYFHVRDARAGGETGLCQPECQYIYDLELPADVTPKPGDDEAIDFQLLTVDEVRKAIANGKFKPNCAHLLLEFFVRHGILTAENEPHYIELVSKFHRKLEFPMP